MEDNGAEYDLKIAIIQSKADARCLQEALRVKDLEMRVAQQISDVEMKASAKIWDAERQAMQHVNDVELKAKDAEARATVNEEARKAVERVKDAEVRAAVNEEARKAAEEARKAAEAREEQIKREAEEKVQQAVATAMALKDKDMEILRLQMQLGQGRRVGEDREEGQNAKVRRVTQVKMFEGSMHFPKLTSSKWSNNGTVGVNAFFRLTSSEDGDAGEQEQSDLPMPQLRAAFANVTDDNSYRVDPDAKFRAFGFCYKGPALSPSAFAKSDHIKEAYGVKFDDMHYVCVICFRRNSRRLASAPAVPYANGPLPHTIAVELVPGCAHHVSVYQSSITTDDPVLAMLKRPSMDKWFWHSSTSYP